MQRPSFLGLTSLAAFVLIAPAALADVVTIEPAKDNTMYEDVGGGLSNGAGQYIFVGSTNLAALRRAVMEFDIAGSLPAGSTITDVSLDLNMSITIVGPEDVSLHRAGQEWGESTSQASGAEGAGGVAQIGDATWLHTFAFSSFWTNVGGDFDPIASATTSVDGVGHYQWNSATLSADVQAWLDDPSSNHGWMLIGDEASPAPTAKRFDSRQNLDPQVRPKLTITFVPPTPPSYCTPKTSSAGCVSTISTSNPLLSPVSGAFDYYVTGSDIQEGKNGLLFASATGSASIPFNGGILCMNPPLKRGPILFSGGDNANECDGSYSTLVNGLVLPFGLDAGSGNSGWYQYWYRDPQNGPGITGTALSDAIQLDFL